MKITRASPVIVAALALGAAGAVWVGAAAAGPRTTFTVGATVLPRAAVSYAAAPSVIAISADDLRRGYVDVETATRLVVSSNDPHGFAIDVFPTAELFTAISVQGADGARHAMFLGRDGGTIVERSFAGRAISVTLSWRFTLADGITPGLYPWPLQLTVRSLVDGQ